MSWNRMPRRGALALLLVASACGSGGNEVISVTTLAPTTTAPTVTEAPVTTEPPTTTSLGPAIGSWDPPCRDQANSWSGANGTEEKVLDKLGPLGASPGLVITTSQSPPPPADTTAGQADLTAPSVNAQRVPGGVLFTAVDGGGADDNAAIVSVVNHDGSLRWVRCLPSLFPNVSVAAAQLQPELAIVTNFVTNPDGSESRLAFSALSLADGSDVPLDVPATGLAALTFVGRSDATLLYGTWDTGNDTNYTALTEVDLLTGQLRPIAAPTEPTIQEQCYAGLHYLNDGTLALYAGDAGQEAGLVKVWAAGIWSTDVATARATAGTRLSWGCNDYGALRGIDASGATIWTRDDLYTAGLEGAYISVDGTTALLQACLGAPPDDGPCEFTTTALDTATGTRRWTLDGFHFIPVGAKDGYAIIGTQSVMSEGSTPAGYEMIDLTNGSPVASWPDQSAFDARCCGDGEFFHVGAFDGVVITVANESISVWYPKALGRAPATVRVP